MDTADAPITIGKETASFMHQIYFITHHINFFVERARLPTEVASDAGARRAMRMRDTTSSVTLPSGVLGRYRRRRVPLSRGYGFSVEVSILQKHRQ
jgi:hypothetical protein